VNEESLGIFKSNVSIGLPLEQAQAILSDPDLSELNNRLRMINEIYNRYCEEFDVPRSGIGDPSPFPQAVIETCLQNGLLRYEDGRLTAKPV
jgi:hypothetical protein